MASTQPHAIKTQVTRAHKKTLRPLCVPHVMSVPDVFQLLYYYPSLPFPVSTQCLLSRNIMTFINLPSVTIYANIGWFWQLKYDSSLCIFMHFLQVAAYNSEGKSNPSQVVEFVTKPDRPSCPCRPVIRGRVLPNSFKMAWGEHLLPVPLSRLFSLAFGWQFGKASLYWHTQLTFHVVLQQDHRRVCLRRMIFQALCIINYWWFSS